MQVLPTIRGAQLEGYLQLLWWSKTSVQWAVSSVLQGRTQCHQLLASIRR
jgi:hypothetical protein